MKTQRDLKYHDLASRRMRAASAHRRAQAREKALKHALVEIDETIRLSLIADKLESQRVRGYNYTPSFREFAKVEDRSEFHAFASRPENRDLLTTHISSEAAYERWRAAAEDARARGLDAKKTAQMIARAIPGVLPGKVPTLSVSKAAPTRGAK